MGQVSVTLDGRTYTLKCADGEEARVIHLAEMVKGRADALSEEFGQMVDDRLLLLTAMMIADELLELQSTSIPRSPPPHPAGWPPNSRLRK